MHRRENIALAVPILNTGQVAAASSQILTGWRSAGDGYDTVLRPAVVLGGGDSGSPLPVPLDVTQVLCPEQGRSLPIRNRNTLCNGRLAADGTRAGNRPSTIPS